MQLIDGRRRRVRAGRVHRFDPDRAAVDAAVLVREISGEHDAAVLVDAAGSLRARERVDGSDPDLVGGVAARATNGHEGQADGEERDLPGHRSNTASTLAAVWVAAGTVQVPDAHRCHESRRPAPRSTGSAATP